MKAEKPPVVRCAVYTRKSTDEGLDSDFNSLDAQREAAESYIASQRHEGWVCLPDRYDDGGFSGATMDRPALRRLLADVEAGRVDCIVVYKLDRLSRSLLDFAQIIGALERNGASFVSITQQFSTKASSGRLLLHILLSFAEFEREIISERTRDKVCAARRKGKWTGGIPMLGYDIAPDGGRLVVNEEEAAQVREIFALYVQKESLRETIRELDRRGWVAKRWRTASGQERGGRSLTMNALHQMLLNPLYVGRVRHNGDSYPGEHEAIVDEEVWQKVQRLMSRNGGAGGRATRNKHGALLRGLLWCGPCESRMTHTYSQKGDRRYRYYICSQAQRSGWDTCPTKSIPAAEVERFVIEQIRCIGADPRLLDEVLTAARSEAQKRSDALDREETAIKQDLRRCSAQVKSLAGKTATHRGETDVTTRLADLQDRIDQGQRRLAEIRAAQATLEREQVDEGELTAALKDFGQVWDSLSPREQARTLHLLVEKVTYDGQKQTVSITFRPTAIQALTQETAA